MLQQITEFLFADHIRQVQRMGLLKQRFMVCTRFREQCLFVTQQRFPPRNSLGLTRLQTGSANVHFRHGSVLRIYCI
ncbi:hypothetical protein D3C75_1001170 [compost metagenome]